MSERLAQWKIQDRLGRRDGAPRGITSRTLALPTDAPRLWRPMIVRTPGSRDLRHRKTGARRAEPLARPTGGPGPRAVGQAPLASGPRIAHYGQGRAQSRIGPKRPRGKRERLVGRNRRPCRAGGKRPREKPDVHTAGIDLGTTNTVAACNGEVVRLTEGTDTDSLLPSVVSFPPVGGILVGSRAKKRRAIDPKNTIVAAKRLMGETLRAYPAQQFRRNYPHDLVEDEQGIVAFRTRAGIHTARDIAAVVVHGITTRSQLEPSKTEVVVGVPACFTADQRAATALAARQAGFAEVRITEEPVATVAAYLNIGRLSANKLRYVVVYDFGGGTFDLAVVACRSNGFEVVAEVGNPYLGGDEVDRAIADWVARTVLSEHSWDMTSDPVIFDRLVNEAELAKIRLHTAPRAVISPALADAAAPGGIEPITLNRERVEEISSRLVRQTFGMCDEALNKASVKASQVDAVLMAGGSSLLPGLVAQVGQYFGCDPCCDIDPMLVVAVGASLIASRRELAIFAHDT